MSFVFKFATLFILGVTLVGCSLEHRHRVIFYDEAWSKATGPKNAFCAPAVRESCLQNAQRQEVTFADQLAKAFKAAPECSTVQFQVLDEGKPAQSGGEYWLLRVDYHPGMTEQPYTLGPVGRHTRVQGESPVAEAGTICEAAKKNGVLIAW